MGGKFVLADLLSALNGNRNIAWDGFGNSNEYLILYLEIKYKFPSLLAVVCTKIAL